MTKYSKVHPIPYPSKIEMQLLHAITETNFSRFKELIDDINEEWEWDYDWNKKIEGFRGYKETTFLKEIIGTLFVKKDTEYIDDYGPPFNINVIKILKYFLDAKDEIIFEDDVMKMLVKKRRDVYEDKIITNRNIFNKIYLDAIKILFGRTQDITTFYPDDFIDMISLELSYKNTDTAISIFKIFENEKWLNDAQDIFEKLLIISDIRHDNVFKKYLLDYIKEKNINMKKGGKKKRVYKKKNGGGEVEDALSSLTLLGLQKGMVGAGEHEMEGGKKKRVYKKKKGGEDTPVMQVMEGGKKKGHLDILRLLVEAGADVNKADNNGETSLWMASKEGNLEVVRLLLDAGANVDKADNKGMTPLYVASYMGHLEVVRLLLDAGADKDKADNNGMTPLYIASYKGHLEVVRLLVDAGADKDKADEYGRTPLLIASQYGHHEVVRLLVDAGADIAKKDKDGNTPLDIAKKKDRTDIIEYLEKGVGTGGGKKKRVYKKKGGEDSLSSLPFPGQEGMVGAGEHEMEGGKKKRVYKKKSNHRRIK